MDRRKNLMNLQNWNWPFIRDIQFNGTALMKNTMFHYRSDIDSTLHTLRVRQFGQSEKIDWSQFCDPQQSSAHIYESWSVSHCSEASFRRCVSIYIWLTIFYLQLFSIWLTSHFTLHTTCTPNKGCTIFESWFLLARQENLHSASDDYYIPLYKRFPFLCTQLRTPCVQLQRTFFRRCANVKCIRWCSARNITKTYIVQAGTMK